MDRVPEHFQPQDSDVIALIRRFPLAWVVTSDLQPLLLPVTPRISSSGELWALAGHIPLSSGLHKRLLQQPSALFLFAGPSSYISPSWFTNRKQAPTWASTSAAFRCEVQLLDDPRELRETLEELVRALEEAHEQPWSLSELDERYELLARHIRPFRAEIREARATFRLCQDEEEETFQDIALGLSADGQQEMCDLMLRERGLR